MIACGFQPRKSGKWWAADHRHDRTGGGRARAGGKVRGPTKFEETIELKVAATPHFGDWWLDVISNPDGWP